MDIAPASQLTCPHDGALLSLQARSLVCPHRHSFDRAKEGYVNLLPVQDKASRDPGDSKEMVAARHRFLETGAYAPIAAAVAEVVGDLIAGADASRPFSILDAGCGEGYYLENLAAALAGRPHSCSVHLAGIDISKWAVRAASKRPVTVTWVVASNRRPPFPARSVDLVLCLFGFPIWTGFKALQQANRHVLLVDPGPDHLLEMREIIYPEVRNVEPTTVVDPDGYSFVDEKRIRASAPLGAASVIADLLSMTPHAHRANAEGRAALAARTELDITIDVVLRVFRRTGT